MKFYAVARGNPTGVFNKWARLDGTGGAKASVDGFPNNRHRSFPTLQKATDWLMQEHGMTQVEIHVVDDPAKTPERTVKEPIAPDPTPTEEDTKKRARSPSSPAA